MILNRGRYCPNGFTCVLPIAFVFLGLILSSSPCFNVMRMNSEKFPWPHFSSLYSERVRLDGLCGPFQHQPCPVPHSRPRAFHSTRCVSPVPVLLESSLPPLRVGTSVCPSLVCIRFGDPGGGLGSTYLTFTDRSVLLILPFSGVLPI